MVNGTLDFIASVLTDYALPPIVISLVVGVPSLVLYIAEVVILLTNGQKFGSAFYRLFLTRAVLHIVGYFNSYVNLRFGRLGLFYPAYVATGSLPIAINWFLCYHLFHSENVATAFLLLHRLTAVALPLLHERIWHWLLPLSIASTLFGPLPITWRIFTLQYEVHYNTGDNITFTQGFFFTPQQLEHPELISKFDASYDSRWAAISSVAFCLVCAAINIACIWAYQRVKRRHVSKMTGEVVISSQGVAERKIENRLTVYAFVTFVAQVLMAVCMINIYISINIFSNFLFFATYNQTPLVNDLCTIVIPSWMMIWASRDMRELVMLVFWLVPVSMRSNGSSIAALPSIWNRSNSKTDWKPPATTV